MTEHHVGSINLTGEGNPPVQPQPVITGAAAVIGDAAWRVNWNVSKEHSEQAQHDALQALVHCYAYTTAVAMETLRRIDPAAAERVAAHFDDDPEGLMWDWKCENVYAWEQAILAGKPVDPEGHVFPDLAGEAAT